MLYLHAYIHNGQTIGTQQQSWLDADLSGNPPFKASTNQSEAGYENITSAENWDKFGELVTDYIFYRYWIQLLLIPIANPNYPTIDFSGWGSLTASQKELMAKYILAPYALRLTVYNDAQDSKNWFNLLDITQGTGSQRFTGRALIVERMRKHVADKVRKEEISMATSQEFFRDVKEYTQNYIATADPQFLLWMTNDGEFTNAGFAERPYYTQALKDELMNIYNGYA